MQILVLSIGFLLEALALVKVSIRLHCLESRTRKTFEATQNSIRKAGKNGKMYFEN